MFSPFAYIRQQARNAFLGEIQDGLAVVADDTDPPANIAELRAQLSAAVQRVALPEREEVTTNKKRKVKTVSPR